MATKYTPIPLTVLTGTTTPPTKGAGGRQVSELDVKSSAVTGDKFLMTDARGRAYSIEKSVLGRYMNTGDFDPNGTYWFDYLTSISSGKVPVTNFPAFEQMVGNINGYSFAVDDYIWLDGFHINHDIKQGSLIYPHVHWTTDGTSTNPVEWELEFTYAAGHNQANFFSTSPQTTVVTVSEAAAGTAWRHMVTEVSAGDAFTAPEVDSLILMRLKRNSTSPTNADKVFGLFVDLHVEIERVGTLNKSPDFYT